MTTIQPLTDTQALRAATLQLISTMVDAEHRPAPLEITMRRHDDAFHVLRLRFDAPEHVQTWADQEKAEGHWFRREQDRWISPRGQHELVEAVLICRPGSYWHGWDHVYFSCATPIPTVTPKDGSL